MQSRREFVRTATMIAGSAVLVRPRSLSAGDAPMVELIPPEQHINVGAIVFPRMDQIDLTGPYAVLSRLPNSSSIKGFSPWKPRGFSPRGGNAFPRLEPLLPFVLIRGNIVATHLDICENGSTRDNGFPRHSRFFDNQWSYRVAETKRLPRKTTDVETRREASRYFHSARGG